MLTIGEPRSDEGFDHLVGWRQIRHALGQIAVGGLVAEQPTDLGNHLAEVDAMAEAHEPVLGDAHVEQRNAPAGTNDAAEFVEERGQVDQVAQCESAGDTVDAGIGERHPQNVGLGAWSAAAVCGQHAKAEVDRQWLVAGFGEVDAQIARAAGEVEHAASGRERQQAHCLAAPANVEPKRHDAVDHVVAAGNGVEHLANGNDLVVALGQCVCIPRGFRHRVQVTTERVAQHALKPQDSARFVCGDVPQLCHGGPS